MIETINFFAGMLGSRAVSSECPQTVFLRTLCPLWPACKRAARFTARSVVFVCFLMCSACACDYTTFSPQDVFDVSVMVSEPMVLRAVSDDEPGQVLLGAGWGKAEGRLGHRLFWATDVQSEVLFPRPEARETDIVVRCRPFTWESASDQEIRLELNGKAAGKFTAKPGWHTYDCALPSGALVKGTNRLVFKSTYLMRPADVVSSRDTRLLGFAIQELALLPRGHFGKTGEIEQPRFLVSESVLELPGGAGVSIPLGRVDRGSLYLEDVTTDDPEARVEILLLGDTCEEQLVWAGAAAELSRRRLRHSWHTEKTISFSPGVCRH